MNFFKEELPEANCSLLENNLYKITGSTRHDLERDKHYALTTDTVARACQALSVSVSTLSTPLQRTKNVYHLPEDFYTDSLPNTTPNLLAASVNRTNHRVDPIKVARLHLTEEHMEKILPKMESVLKNSNKGQGVSK